MKKLFTILLVTILTSCESSLQLPKPPKDNTDYKNIIGKSVKIGIFEIAQYDFPKKMNWDDAFRACDALGDGWRLPTREELVLIYKNKYKIGGFTSHKYWSSTKFDYKFGDSLDLSSKEFVSTIAWYQDFYFGGQGYDGKRNAGYVRAVRTF